MHTKGEHHVKTGVILPQVGELPETRKGDLEQILLSGLEKEHALWAPQSQNFGLPDL